MSDLISRQAVLNLLHALPPEEAMTKAMLIQSVKQMDVAQPEKRTEERTEKHACDCISRQAAIEALEKIDCSDGVGISSLKCDAVDDAVTAIKVLPSAQPERKRGKWVFYEDRAPVWDIAGEKTWARAYKCSECGFVHAVIEDFGIYQYCPQCGTDMREDNHETD